MQRGPKFLVFQKVSLTLARFKTRLSFVDHVYAAFTAHNAAIAVAALKGAKRVLDFHSHSPI
jgi:hypothetical protein